MKKLLILLLPILLLSACGSSDNSSQQSITNETNTSKAKTLSGTFTVGEDADLAPGVYDLKALGDNYGTISASTDDDPLVFLHFMASPKGLKKYQKYKNTDKETYSEEILGVVLKEGYTIESDISVQFTKVD